MDYTEFSGGLDAQRTSSPDTWGYYDGGKVTVSVTGSTASINLTSLRQMMGLCGDLVTSEDDGGGEWLGSEAIRTREYLICVFDGVGHGLKYGLPANV